MSSREGERAEAGASDGSEDDQPSSSSVIQPRDSDQDEHGRRSSRFARIFFLLGGVLLIATLLSIWLGSILSQKNASSRSSQLDPSKVPLVSGVEPIPELFTRAGCPVCHTIPGIAGAEGRVGPKLVLGLSGPTRLADPAYKGQARTVHEYVIESVLSPGIYVVPGFSEQAMPRWYGQKLSATALEKIATYLESLNE